MKKLIYLFVISLFSSLLSCTSNKKDEPIPLFADGDSIYVRNIAERYLEHIKNKEYEEAFSELRTIRQDSIFLLTEKDEEDLMQQYYVFPVVNYKLDYMDFRDNYNVDVVYTIEFFEKEPGSDMPNTYKINFAPKRINATWYLCIKNKSELRKH